MSIVFIIKVKVLVFIQWSCGSLPVMLNVELRTIVLF